MSENKKLSQEQIDLAEAVRPKEVDDSFAMYFDTMTSVTNNINEAVSNMKKHVAILKKNKYPNSGFNIQYGLDAIKRVLGNHQNQLKDSE